MARPTAHGDGGRHRRAWQRAKFTMPGRRRFQFSLRSCLIFTTVICLWLGWRAATAETETEEQAVAAIKGMGGYVLFADDGKTANDVLFAANIPLNAPPGYTPDVSHITLTDDGMHHISRLKQLTRIGIAYVPITDAGIRRLRGLKNLDKILLDHTLVTQDGISSLQKSLPGCKIIYIK